MKKNSEIPASLKSILDQYSPLYNEEDMELYRQDWSGTQGGMPLVVVRPANTHEVSQIAAACHEAGLRITVQGGRTGLAGGASPDAGDVVVSLSRMNLIEKFDREGGTVTVQAGVPLQTVCETVEEEGWYFPLDCGARGSCQIGGNVATNAGGNRVLRYGTMRDLVLGLEVVLSDGTVLPMMNEVLKNNTGVDLKHLFIGSEGTLGIVTRVVLRLFPKPERRYTALCATDSFAKVVELLKRARAQVPTLSAFEVMWGGYVERASATLRRDLPFERHHSLYVLLESEGSTQGDAVIDLDGFLELALSDGLVADAIIPQSDEQSQALWRMRDAIGDILSEIRPYVAFDVGVPTIMLEAVTKELESALRTRFPDAHYLFFGHLGDGNLHLATGPHKEGDFSEIERTVYEVVRRAGGSISAEHGIGRLKKPYLGFSRSPAEIAVMRAIKQALDADHVLNRARIHD